MVRQKLEALLVNVFLVFLCRETNLCATISVDVSQRAHPARVPDRFFFFFLNQEDTYLRQQYPVYADSSSAFEVLAAADEMEAKHRTHEQIKARVKKLGLTAASHASTGVDSESAPDTDEEPGGNHADMAGNNGESEEAEMADKTGGSDEEGTAGVTGPASPVHVRKIESKNHGQSDDDDEGLFSSTEVSIMHSKGSVCFNIHLVLLRPGMGSHLFADQPHVERIARQRKLFTNP